MSKEELDNFLLDLLNADKISIRRKLIEMKKFLEENTILLNQNKDDQIEDELTDLLLKNIKKESK